MSECLCCSLFCPVFCSIWNIAYAWTSNFCFRLDWLINCEPWYSARAFHEDEIESITCIDCRKLCVSGKRWFNDIKFSHDLNQIHTQNQRKSKQAIAETKQQMTSNHSELFVTLGAVKRVHKRVLYHMWKMWILRERILKTSLSHSLVRPKHTLSLAHIHMDQQHRTTD